MSVSDHHETDTEFIHTMIHVQVEHSEMVTECVLEAETECQPVMVTDHDHETECEHDEVHAVEHHVDSECVSDRDDIEHDRHRVVKEIEPAVTEMESECEFIEIELEYSHVEQGIECHYNPPHKETGGDDADFRHGQIVCLRFPDCVHNVIEAEFEHSATQTVRKCVQKVTGCEHGSEYSHENSASDQVDGWVNYRLVYSHLV